MWAACMFWKADLMSEVSDLMLHDQQKKYSLETPAKTNDLIMY